MQKIVDGVLKFQNDVFPQHKDLFAELANQQQPEVLFITCADSRIDPGLITQSRPGDLFICRNAGNIVPPYTEQGDGMSASIDYAVKVLGVSHIVVCGHSDCGAMKGLMNLDALGELPHVQQWLEHSLPAASKVADEDASSDASRLKRLTEANVLQQLEHLKTYPAIAEKLANGEVELHAWMYDIGAGNVCCQDTGEEFTPLQAANDSPE